MGVGRVSPEELIQDTERRHGPQAAARVQHWLNLIEQGKTVSDASRLFLASNFLNGARYASDEETYGVKDYWATPLEFLIHDAGDCEDFAIAKYFTARAMGVEEARLRLTYVLSRPLDQSHMVLAYYATPGTEPLILDNLEKRILSSFARSDLVPLYSFNGSGLFLTRTWLEQVPVPDPTELSLWRGLCTRYADGIAINAALFPTT